MLQRGSARWAGSGVSARGQRLSRGCSSPRHFSLHATPRPARLAQARSPLLAQQTRNLSLFGWGSSSKSSSDPSPVVEAQNNASTIEIGPNSIEAGRQFKASHATSVAPDPSVAHVKPSAIEPDIVQRAEEALSFPAGSNQAPPLLEDGDVVATMERIGYLKEICGLDFGWGPTALMEWFMEHLHITGGLGWATTIIVASIATRLLLIKPMINAQKESAKLKELNPVIAPLRAQSNQYLKDGDRQKALEITAEVRAIQKEYDIKMRRIFTPLLIQFPLQYGSFRLLNAMGRLPVPAFENEDWLWNHDLSFSDPYYITPALSAFTIWLQFRQNQKSADTTASPIGPGVMKLMGNILPFASFAFMSFQPGSVQLYFLTSGAVAFASTSLLRQTWFRSSVGLPPAVNPTPATPAATASTGGLQRRVTTPKAVEPEVDPATQNRSFIDRHIDSVKTSFRNAAKDAPKGGVFDRFSDSAEEKAKKAAKTKAEQYELKRSSQLQVDREARRRAIHLQGRSHNR